MNISLRKANAIQLSIQEAIKALYFDTNIVINQFETPEQKFKESRDTFFENLQIRKGLVESLYKIRMAVSLANAKSGISDKLATCAMFEKDIVFYSGFANKQPRLSDEFISGKLKKMDASNEEWKSDEFFSSILSKEEISDFNKIVLEIKRKKQKIQDELLETNVSVQIDLDQSTIDLLTKIGIL